MINSSFKYCVKLIRDFKFNGFYDFNKDLINYFKELSKLNNFEGSYFFEGFKRDVFVFSFPLSPMKTVVRYPIDFSMDKLLEMGNCDESCVFGDVFNSYLLTTPKYINFDTKRGRNGIP